MDEHDIKIIFSSKSDEHATPDFLYQKLDKIHGFTLDPAATDQNHKCAKYYTIQDDGLSKPWKDEIVFLNPPYSQISKWIEKAYYEAKNNMAHVVLLIPVRSDTKYWHQFVMKANKVTFVKGRLKFGSAKAGAPFPSCIVEFHPYSVNTPVIDSIENK